MTRCMQAGPGNTSYYYPYAAPPPAAPPTPPARSSSKSRYNPTRPRTLDKPIGTPPASLTWKVGDPIGFAGHATDAQDGTLPAGALSWSLILHHCYTPSDCHTHLIQTFGGVSSGSFTAPDHAYPCWLELQLTATDSGGLAATTSVRLDPKTVVLTFKTNPGGLMLNDLVVNEASRTTPFSVTVVVGSANSVSAPSPQLFNKSTYNFVSWSDGGPQSHTITAPTVNTTYTATYRKH